MGQLFPRRPASGPGGGSVLLLQVADVQARNGSAGWGGGAWSGQSHDNASYPGAQRDDATLSGPVTSAGWELLAPTTGGTRCASVSALVLQRVAEGLHPDEAVAKNEGVDSVFVRPGVRGSYIAFISPIRFPAGSLK
jgi:hypothetical protein